MSDHTARLSFADYHMYQFQHTSVWEGNYVRDMMLFEIADILNFLCENHEEPKQLLSYF